MKKYINALKALNAMEIQSAGKKEASRQVGEMLRWKKNQITFDPEGMLWDYEDVFPLILKAERYRTRIYNRNREIEKIKFDLTVAQVNDDRESWDSLNEEWADLEAEQMGLVWRIMKIYCAIRHKVLLTVGSGVDEVFKDFEYKVEDL